MKTRQLSPKNQGFIKGIKAAIPKHCSNCGHKYEDKDLTLIQKDTYTAILHLTCSSCKESYLISVLSPLGDLHGSSRIPLKLDITSAQEAKRFIGGAPVSADDVIDVHEFLKEIANADDLKLFPRKGKKQS